MKNDFKEFINGFKAMFTDLKTKEGRRKQIPNWITFSRLVLSCFIPPLAMSGNLIALGWASGLAAVALGTDFVDGKLARKLNAVSEFGKNLDPVCDKLSAAILLAPLMIKASPIITLSLCVNLGLEAGIALVNLNSKAKGNKPKTTILGKVKTASLSALLVSSYLSFSIPVFATITPIAEVITLILQTKTLIDYKRIDKKEDRKRIKQELTEASIQDETDDNFEIDEPALTIDLITPEITINDPDALDGLSIEQLNVLRVAATGEPSASDVILDLVEKGYVKL